MSTIHQKLTEAGRHRTYLYCKHLNITKLTIIVATHQYYVIGKTLHKEARKFVDFMEMEEPHTNALIGALNTVVKQLTGVDHS